MHQILAQLQNGTQETVKDNGDGTVEVRINPPSALHLRAARLIVQVINERDQIVNANNLLNRHIHSYMEENENLKRQVKELNERINSQHISKDVTEENSPTPEGLDSSGEVKAAGSEAT